MAELLLLLLVLSATALAIAWPLLGPEAVRGPDPHERGSAAVRHRLALEALGDLEADRRAGSLDEASYVARRAEAEAHAARTLAELDRPASPSAHPPSSASGGRRLAAAVGAGVIGLALVAFALPAPFGTAERTETNQALADRLAAEEARQAEIARLRARITADPRDAQAFSDLADALLAGGTPEERRLAAAALLVVISLEPDDASAYRRLITAYIDAGAWTDARAALDAFGEIAARDDPDVPFFAGIIALRGEDDPGAAARHFDRFLELAPDDPRAVMVRGLRDEAAGG